VLLYLSGLAFTPLRPVHFALGFALIPILVVKLASTAWRAIGYYFHRDAYRDAGPPWLLPRLIALPLAIAAVLATVSGVVLWSQGTDHGTWAAIHTDSVIALGGIVLVHVAVYLRKALRASAKSLAATAVNRPERVIVWALLAALVAGAIATGLEPTWNPSAAADPTTAAQP
jgi:ABC-type sulfate transport system permease subunit